MDRGGPPRVTAGSREVEGRAQEREHLATNASRRCPRCVF